MKLNMNFEIVEIDDEYMAIPVGDVAKNFHGIIALSAPAAFILKKLDGSRDKSDLIKLLGEEYDATDEKLEQDFDQLLKTCTQYGLIVE